MNLKELTDYLDSIEPALQWYQKQNLTSMFYDIYLKGIKEGKNQVKNTFVENLLLLMDTEK